MILIKMVNPHKDPSIRESNHPTKNKASKQLRSTFLLLFEPLPPTQEVARWQNEGGQLTYPKHLKLSGS